MATTTKKKTAKPGEKPTAKGPRKVRVPMFRVSYQHITKPQKSEDGNSDIYQVAAIWPGDADMKEVLQVCKEAKIYKWKKDIPADVKMPFTRYTKEWFVKEYGEKKGPKMYKDKIAKNPEYEGCIVAQLKSYNRQPGVMDANKNTLDMEDKDDAAKFYSGLYATATVTAWAYEHEKGNCGVSLSLQNIMILKKGEKLAGGAASAEEDFEEVDVSEYGIDNSEMFDEEDDEEDDEDEDSELDLD